MSGELERRSLELLKYAALQTALRNVDLPVGSPITAAESDRWMINAGKLWTRLLIPDI